MRKLGISLALATFSATLFSLDSRGELLPPNTATEPLPNAEVARVAAMAFPENDTIAHAEGSRTFDDVSGHTLSRHVRIFFRARDFGRQFCRRQVIELYTTSGDVIRETSEFDHVARRESGSQSCDDVPRDRFVQFSHGFGEEIEADIFRIVLDQFESFVESLDELPEDLVNGATSTDCQPDDLTAGTIQAIHYQKFGPRKISARYIVAHPCAHHSDYAGNLWIALLLQDKFTDRQHKDWGWTDYEMGVTVF